MARRQASIGDGVAVLKPMTGVEGGICGFSGYSSEPSDSKSLRIRGHPIPHSRGQRKEHGTVALLCTNLPFGALYNQGFRTSLRIIHGPLETPVR